MAPVIQTKLKIGEPNDEFEQEADRVADAVVHMPEPQAPARATGVQRGVGERVQRLCPECEEELGRQPIEEEEEEELQAKAIPGHSPEVTPDLGSAISALKGGGHPLPRSLRSFFEPRFGYDFSAVRVHADAKAGESARAVNALAYTVGDDIVFGAGRYTPGTLEGIRLLAHELAHVVQGSRGVPGTVSVPWLYRQADVSGATRSPSGEEEAEQRAFLIPRFPGCSPHDRIRLDFQIGQARSLVEQGMVALDDELDRIARGSEIITVAGKALDTHFHTHNSRHIRTIMRRLDRIHDRLSRGSRNWRCVSEQACRRECDDAAACADVGTPVFVCPSHFEFGDLEGPLTLVHEAAHQAGYGGDTYAVDRRFIDLTTAEALANADSYAMFVRDNVYGGPIISPRPAGAAPERPHEREARARAESSAWTSRDLSITLYITDPLIGLWGHFGGSPDPIPSRLRRIQDRIQGKIWFHVDSKGEGQRGRPYTRPSVSVRMTLVRNVGGRRIRSVLFDGRDLAAADAGPGRPLRTTFSSDFDLRFLARGTLHIEARLQDFDTATTIAYRDRLDVRP
ncbi:MAG: DUF4157 domain-containing protein [Gammaproteobacteria bacterium]|nr:DUF4157 domain-containing protein [Gammaproteobacteria bacterium]